MDQLSTSHYHKKVGQQLHLIPGGLSLHLDTPLTPLVVHSIPTTLFLTLLLLKLTSLNHGLCLASEPRWLTTPEHGRRKLPSLLWLRFPSPMLRKSPRKHISLTSPPPAAPSASITLALNPLGQMPTVWPLHHQIPQAATLPLVLPPSPHRPPHLPIHLMLSQQPLMHAHHHWVC